MERAVVGLLRLAIRLLRREEISGQVSRVQLEEQEGVQKTEAMTSFMDIDRNRLLYVNWGQSQGHLVGLKSGIGRVLRG